MALRIRLRRMGRKKAPTYRIVVAESSMPRDGRFVANLGHYNPRAEPPVLVVDKQRARYWLDKGALPTDTVVTLLRWAKIDEPDATPVEEAVAAVKSGARKASKAVAGAAGKAAGAVRGAAAGLVETVQDAVEAAQGAVEDAVEAAQDAVEDVVESVQEAVEDVRERVTGSDDNAPAAEVATEAPAAEASAEETPAAEGETPKAE